MDNTMPIIFSSEFLEIENSLLHVFSFLHKIEFWKSFLFSVHFKLPNMFFSFKNKKIIFENGK